MRLLNLPPSVQRKVAAGVISAGHARALLGLNDERDIELLANRVVSEGLSVRSLEEIIAAGLTQDRVKRKLITRDTHLTEVEEELSDYFDTRISVQSGKAKGKIIIEFSGTSDLQRVLALIKKR